MKWKVHGLTLAPALALSFPAPARAADDLTASQQHQAGRPRRLAGAEVHQEEGELAGLIHFLPGLGAQFRGLEYWSASPDVRDGFSGSPVFNDRAEVVGVFSGYDWSKKLALRRSSR